MTPRFYCTEVADEQQFEQDKRPLKEEEFPDRIVYQNLELGPFGSDAGVQECDLFWYPELQR